MTDRDHASRRRRRQGYEYDVVVLAPSSCLRHDDLGHCRSCGDVLDPDVPVALVAGRPACFDHLRVGTPFLACGCRPCRRRADYDVWRVAAPGVWQTVWFGFSSDASASMEVFLPRVPAELVPPGLVGPSGERPVALGPSSVLFEVPRRGDPIEAETGRVGRVPGASPKQPARDTAPNQAPGLGGFHGQPQRFSDAGGQDCAPAREPFLEPDAEPLVPGSASTVPAVGGHDGSCR